MRLRIEQGKYLLLLAAAVLSLAGCSGGKKKATSEKSPSLPYVMNREDSVQLEAYASRGERRKVVIIGFDAASWNILTPMIENGRLPNLKRLMDDGAYGDLLSIPFFITPPAWTSMFSGCKPWKTGIYSFGKMDTATREPVPVSSVDVKVPMLWDMTSQAGLRTAVIKVPLTYPARRINGIMVTGFLTPGQILVKKVMTKSPPLKEASASEIEKYSLKSLSPPKKATVKIYESKLDVYVVDRFKEDDDGYDTALLRIHRVQVDSSAMGRIVIPEQVIEVPLDEYTPWMKILVEEDGINMGLVRLGVKMDGATSISITCTPVYWEYIKKGVRYCYPDSLVHAIERRFDRFTPNVPYVVPTIPDHVADDVNYFKFFYGMDDWDLFIFQFQVTDIIQHWDGDGPFTQAVYERIDEFLGEFLRELPPDAIVVIASDHGSRGYEFKVKLNPWLNKLGTIAIDRKGDIDYKNSIAYHMSWGIYINRDELEKRWRAVRDFKPANEEDIYDEFVDFLIEKAKSISYASSRAPLNIEIYRAPKERVQPAPDLVVKGEYADFVVHHDDIFHRGDKIKISPFEHGKKFHHRMKGIFIISGKGIRNGYKTGVKNIYDITPTVLYMMGLPVAGYFDGKVMEDIFEPDFLAQHPVGRIRTYNIAGASDKVREFEQEKLEEKLRAIGYVQ